MNWSALSGTAPSATFMNCIPLEFFRWLGVSLLLSCAALSLSAAEITKVIAGGSYTDLADFEKFATRAKQSGVTHIRITDSLPWSTWQYDDPADPYPSWVISNPGLLNMAQYIL